MNLGQEYLLKLFKVAENDIDVQIYNYQILLQNLLNNFDIKNNLANLNRNNLKFNLKNDNTSKNKIINNNLFEGKNFISYGFVLFLSRILRLFWEEKFFLKKKLYYQTDNFEFNIVNNLNQIQIMFIKNMLIKFTNSVNQFKMDLLQNAADITSKANKLNNYINDIEQFLKNNSGYAINEIRKRLSKEENMILNEHRRNLNYFISLFNFEKFSNDLEIIIGIAHRAIEVLNLLDNIYKINISKEIQKRKSYNILNIKIKDLYKNTYPFVVNELLQIIYEFYFKEKNMEFASIKLQEIIYQSPNIINKNSASAIEGNFILKFCNHYQLDDIDKIKYIKEALEKINLNLNSIKIEKVVNYLSKFQEFENIIKICLKKGKMLQPEIDTNIDIQKDKDNMLFNIYNYNNNENNSNKDTYKEKDINKIEEENNTTEFYKCINIILNILSFLHNSIIYNCYENYIQVKYTKAKEFTIPSYIHNLLTNKNIEDLINMENLLLNLAFKEEYDFIHYNVIEFMKENNMMNKLQNINSPFIENYLNSQINKNNNSPQSLFSMFKFYLQTKNYSCATKILATLINYVNNKTDGTINYVSLDDRITYVNTMLNTLDLQIKDAENNQYNAIPEQKINEINEAKNLKDKMINIRNILNIQYEIKSYLTTYINNVINEPEGYNNDENLDSYKNAIIELDNKALDLNTLYNSYAKNFSIFDCCMSIFFQLYFANNKNNNSRINPKEVKNIFCEYFCKFDDRTLMTKWPYINFDRFNRIFNILLKEKSPYQNFYDMLINNNMKNKYRDLLPLEFIISILESMNRKIIFNDNNYINGDNYLMKLKQDFNQPHNPFWFIIYLKEQILLPISYIFNEYYIIYLSIIKDFKIKKINKNDFIIDDSNINSNVKDNLSTNTFASNNISAFNNSNTNFEELGLVFDGNLSRNISKKTSQDNKFYCIFLLLGIEKMWINRIINIIDESDIHNNQQMQRDIDLKQFNLEMKKNGNNKIKSLIKEYFEELTLCKMLFSQQKYKVLKIFGETIEKEVKIIEDKVMNYFQNLNSFENSNYNQNRIIKNDNFGNNNDMNSFGGTKKLNSVFNYFGKFGNNK